MEYNNDLFKTTNARVFKVDEHVVIAFAFRKTLLLILKQFFKLRSRPFGINWNM